MDLDGLRKNVLHSRMEWEMMMEGVPHDDFRRMILKMGNDLKSRLLIIGDEYEQHLSAKAEGFIEFSMAYMTCIFQHPRLYSGGYIAVIIRRLPPS